MRKLIGAATLAGVLLALGIAEAAAAPTHVWIVDRDGLQCANADFSSIQTAVDAAAPGDMIRVCPDLYRESVTVDKPLTLLAGPDAIEAIDCFQAALPALSPDQYAIVDPVGDGFTEAFKLEADDIGLGGFVVEGASVGVDASDEYSGYRVHHNAIRSNTLFAIDFGSAGARASRVDHNCIRTNRFGLVSELDDDALWPDLPNRAAKARDLIHARIDHNATFANLAGLEAGGPGRHVGVTIDHNVSRGDRDAFLILNSEGSSILGNEAAPTRFGIAVGGANAGLEISGNRVEKGLQGIVFVPPTFFIDQFAAPTTGALIADNVVTGQAFDGIVAAAARLHQSLLLNNNTSGNARDGIILRVDNSGNVLRGNVADGNREYGIYAQGAVANLFEANEMLGNGVYDARDDKRSANTWLANDCVTDFPAGTICGAG